MCVRSILLLAALVPPLAGPLRAQSLEGRVFDEVTGRPVGQAWVAVLDSASLVEMGRMATDEQGRFSLRLIPQSFALVVGMPGYSQSPPLYFSLEPDRTEEAVIALRTLEGGSIEIALAGEELRPSHGARVLGRVLDARNGKPLVGAEITLEATGHRAFSGGEGAFTLQDIAPGLNEVRVSHLAYGEQSRTFEMQPGAAYELVVRLDPDAIELQGIDVTVRSQGWARRMDDVWIRMNSGMGGHFLTADELEVRGHPPLSSALRSVPSVRIVNRGAFDQRIVLRGCTAALWVDGVEVYNPRDEDSSLAGPPPSLAEFLRATTADVEVVEVFPGAATLPPEFARPGTSCAVAVWTKR